MEKLGKELGPTMMVILTASGRVVEADDDIDNVDLYPEAVRARDKLRPERAPHRLVEYVPRSALDAMRAERDAALAEADRLRAALARVRAVCERPPRYTDRHMQAAAEEAIGEVRAALGEPR